MSASVERNRSGSSTGGASRAAVSPMATGTRPTRMYIAPAITAPRRATTGERAAITRDTSSAATTEPMTGMDHSSSNARKPGLSPPPSSEMRPGSIAASASAGPPSRAVTAQARISSPTTITMPWMRSVMASASSPPSIV